MDADIKAEFVQLKSNELTSSYLLDSEFISSTSYLKDERIMKSSSRPSVNGYQSLDHIVVTLMSARPLMVVDFSFRENGFCQRRG